MTLYECLTCGGIYDPDQPGGYYHVCPSILKNKKWVKRKDHRDENWEYDSKRKAKIKSAGKGRKKWSITSSGQLE